MKKNPDMDKLIKDSTLSEYAHAQRSSNWHVNLNTHLCMAFLEEEDIDKLYLNNFRISTYEKHIFCVCFDEFLSTSGFKVIRSYVGDRDDVRPYEYENIEIGYKTTKKVINEGVLFLEHAESKIRLIFSMENYCPDMYELSLQSRREHTGLAEKFLEALKEYASKNNYLKNKKITPDFAFLELNKNYTWDSVVLDAKTKGKVRSNIDTILSNLSIYEINEIPFKRGIILKGVPGVGKTLIGKILCNTAPCTVIWVTPRHLEQSKRVAMICDLARNLAPSILFLEDIDLYGASRDNNFNKSILGELMNQLDGIADNKNIIVIATTNRSNELERALRNRPGRFDSVIEIKIPGTEERERMLRLYTEKFARTTVDFGRLAEETENYTGAHVKDLVNLAVMTAIEIGSYDKVSKKIILTHEHFEKNVKLVGKKKINVGFDTPSKDDDDRGRPLREYYDDD